MAWRRCGPPLAVRAPWFGFGGWSLAVGPRLDLTVDLASGTCCRLLLHGRLRLLSCSPRSRSRLPSARQRTRLPVRRIAARQEPKPVGEAAAVAARAAALPARRRHYARGLRSARQGRTRVRRQPLASCRRDTLRSPRLRACAASSEMRWRRSTTCGRERRNTARASYRSPYSEDSMRLARGRPTPTGSNPLSPPSPPYRDEGGARADAAGEGWTSGPLSHAERAPAVPTPHATQTSGLPRRMWADPNRI